MFLLFNYTFNNNIVPKYQNKYIIKVVKMFKITLIILVFV